MALIWMNNMVTGLSWQDKQHKEYVARTNALIHAMGNSRGSDELPELLNFLDTYMRVHFNKEEAAMNMYKYPQVNIHKTHHRLFIDNIDRVKREFHYGATQMLVIGVRKILVSWFINHIISADKMLGAYIIEKNELYNTKAVSYGLQGCHV